MATSYRQILTFDYGTVGEERNGCSRGSTIGPSTHCKRLVCTTGCITHMKNCFHFLVHVIL